MVAEEEQDQVVKRAGRGFIFILGAKLYFLVAGYAIIVALSWILGPVLYGLYGLVVGAISVLDNVIVTGTIQGVSRFTAEEEGRAGPVKAAALKLQTMLGGGVAALFVLVAPLIAGFQRDPSLTPYLRLAAGVVLCYAFYSVFVGSANGQRRFGLQAGLDAFYVTIRGGLIVGLAAAGFAVWGAISGFVAASFVILVLAAILVGIRDLKSGFPLSRLALFMLPVMGYLFLVNVVMFADLFLLKRLAVDALAGQVDPAEAGGHAVGVYVATGQLARITYQALLAVTFVIFPLVSRSTFAEDNESTRSYITSTMRYSLIFAGAMAVIMAALPDQVLGFPFGPEYQVGSRALLVLAPAYACFALFVVATTILNAAGRRLTALAVSTVTVGFQVAACWILIPRATTIEGVLFAAAVASLGAMGLGWILSVVTLRLVFGAPLGLLSLLRVALACASCVVLARYLPHGSRMLTLAECAALGILFLAVLALTRELGRRDLSRLGSVLGLRRR